jgi:enoyl-CoA hydratase/carnithine racemase
MPYEQILYDVTERVATVTLNRPDKLNAWTAKMEEEVSAAIRAAAADDAVRAIVITGAGKGFCAGADMSLLSSLAADGGGSRAAGLTANLPDDGVTPADFRKKYAWMLAVPKPIIAAIHGPAVGLGFVIPLYCDFRFASETARFSVIFSKRGLVAEYGLAWMLPRIVGVPNALDLILTSRMVDAPEALRIGLVQRVFPEASFPQDVRKFAVELAATVSPRSLRVMKSQIYAGLTQTLGEAFDLAIEEMKTSLQADDFKEGIAHFLEKRAAAFTGR